MKDNKLLNDSIHYDQFFNQEQAHKLLEKKMEEEEMRELNKLTNSIYDLKQFFLQAEELVFNQGTIIDWIDFNIQITMETVQIGNRNLNEALEH